MSFFGKRKSTGNKPATTFGRLRSLRCEPLEDRRMLSITLFVDDGAAAGGDGLGWGTAYDDLQSALTQAAMLNADADTTNDVDSIWIAEGTYRPSAELETGNARSASFSLVDGVDLYGGFAGTESTLAERDLSAGHATTLSGDLGIVDDISDNSFHVVYCGDSIEATVDGILITDGNSDGLIGITLFGGYGAGIYNDDGVLTFVNGTVSGNTAQGTVVFNLGDLVVVDSTVSDNSGRGIESLSWLDYGPTTLTIRDSVISNNRGGVRIAGSFGSAVLTITGCTISNNSTSGGVCCYADDDYDAIVTITDSAISNNSAVWSGGGIYNLGCTLTITNCTISGNSTDNDDGGGGGVYNGGGNVNVTITGSTISGNSATNDDGGGIYCFGSQGSLVIADSTISNNSAHDRGGGIYLEKGIPATVTNSVISNNSASYDGGGIYSRGILAVTNSTLSGNSSRNGGGGISNEGRLSNYDCILTVTDSTLWGNSSGIHSKGVSSVVRINNTIVAGNGVIDSSDIYCHYYAGPISGSHNLIGDGTGQSSLVDGVDGNQVGTSTAPIDPRFVDAGNGDYRLLAGSPSVDAGDNGLVPIGVVMDLDGNYRIANGTVDIGAYEFGAVPLLKGDANLDGKVDGADVTILANNWQAGVPDGDTENVTWSMGDFNGDGKVDGSDVTILANNWQAGVSSTAAVVSEPEPEDKPTATRQFTPPMRAGIGMATVPRRAELAAKKLIVPTAEATDAALVASEWSEGDYTAVAKDLVAVSAKKSIGVRDELLANELDLYAEVD